MKRNTLRNLILAAVVAIAPVRSFAGVAVSIAVAPPPLRVYVQPSCPDEGYIWTPGYWAYGPNGYYWVPGAWVLPPQTGYLFTPGYWGFVDGVYVWHEGYWGAHVGYYGEVNYGFGYTGSGFSGGRWENGHFFYNRAVSNVGPRFHNAYREEVADRGHDRSSFHRGDEHRGDDRRLGHGEHGHEHHEDHERKEAHTRKEEHAKKEAGHSGKAQERSHRE
jgi:hypothetical protein